jgi:hypothetical protein
VVHRACQRATDRRFAGREVHRARQRAVRTPG